MPHQDTIGVIVVTIDPSFELTEVTITLVAPQTGHILLYMFSVTVCEGNSHFNL